ncbi:PRO41 protein [Thozetella sp. PMI_491]|nr:PRO41 protein [Thozetella sp. PMI_491]
MGRLIKNHWARLIVMAAATWNLREIAAAIEAFFWPKIFWDFATKSLDGAMHPVPVLQIVNLVFGLFLLAWEWPLGALAGSALHRSIEARLAFLPLSALAAVLTYQGTNAALYEVIAVGVYFWAYSEGEIICAKPWTLPQRGGGRSRV